MYLQAQLAFLLLLSIRQAQLLNVEVGVIHLQAQLVLSVMLSISRRI